MESFLKTEAEAILNGLRVTLHQSGSNSYSQLRRYVKSRVTIIMVQVTYRCIWDLWVTVIQQITQRTQWEYGDGLNLYR